MFTVCDDEVDSRTICFIGHSRMRSVAIVLLPGACQALLEAHPSLPEMVREFACRNIGRPGFRSLFREGVDWLTDGLLQLVIRDVFVSHCLD